MPGYILVEESAMAQYREGGVQPVAGDPIGFLDFLRELAQDVLPFSKYAQLVVVGLEEVLFAAEAGAEEREIALRRSPAIEACGGRPRAAIGHRAHGSEG